MDTCSIVYTGHMYVVYHTKQIIISLLPVKCGGSTVEQPGQEWINADDMRGSLQFNEYVIFIVNAQRLASLTKIIVRTVATMLSTHYKHMGYLCIVRQSY